MATKHKRSLLYESTESFLKFLEYVIFSIRLIFNICFRCIHKLSFLMLHRRQSIFSFYPSALVKSAVVASPKFFRWLDGWMAGWSSSVSWCVSSRPSQPFSYHTYKTVADRQTVMSVFSQKRQQS